MPAYLVAHVDVTDPDKYEEYKRLVPASLAKFGGRFLVRGPVPEVLEGSWLPKRLVIVEFPSAEKAHAWYRSPEYAPAKALRQAASEGTFILLEGF